jgi:hypothetical protein
MKPKNSSEIRANLREALRDELATVRVINGALLSPGVQPAEYKSLTVARADALAVVRRLLVQLHPSSHTAARRKAKP